MRSGFIDCSLLRRPTRFVERLARVPVLLALILASLLFPTVVFPLHDIGEIRPLDLQLGYSPRQAYEYLAALGPDRRTAYTRWALTSDLAFPVVYASALSVALMLALSRLLAPKARCLALFPFLIVLADWSENLSLAGVTRAFPEPADALVRFASLATTMKWAFILATVLMLLGAAGYLAVRGDRNA